MNANDLMRLLDDLASDEECSFDHSGNCQTHSWFGERPCPQGRLRTLLASEDETTIYVAPAVYGGIIDDRLGRWQAMANGVGNEGFQRFYRNELRRFAQDASYKLHQTMTMLVRAVEDLDAATLTSMRGYPTLSSNATEAERLMERLSTLTAMLDNYRAVHPQEGDDAT